MRIHIATDHAGFELKEGLVAWLKEEGHEVVDHGAHQLNEKDDYPDFVIPAAKAVGDDPTSLGIVIGGSGQGEAIAANKAHPAVRAGVYYGGTLDIIELMRQHNNANVLSLGARFMALYDAQEAVELFLETGFSGDERHIRRIAKL